MKQIKQQIKSSGSESIGESNDRKMKMNPSILCKTENENNYLYNFNLNQVMLIHPIFKYILNLVKRGDDPGTWMANLTGDGIKINNHGPFTKEEIQYYYHKYLLFSINNLFAEVKQEEKFNGTITAEQIYRILSNVKNVVFEVTEACNLNCTYCNFGEYYENYDKRENKRLSITKAKNLLNYLLKFWRSPLNTSHKNAINIAFYGGEPLLNINFIREIVNYCQQMEVPRHNFTFSMTTNALLLEKYMEFLVANDFNLLISLDGNKQNNGHRVFPDGGEAYDEIFRNVQALKGKYPDYFKKRTNFNVVLHDKNSSADIYEYFKQNFDKIPLISELNSGGIKDDKQEEFLKMRRTSQKSFNLSKDHLKLKKEMFSFLSNIKALCNIINNCSNHCFMDYTQLLFPIKDQERIPTGTCLPFSNRMFLSVNGKILPCERIGHQYCYGKVNEESVYLDAQKVARTANAYFDRIRSKCVTCYATGICLMCVYSLKIDGDQDVKNCPQYTDREKFSRFLSGWLSKLEENPGYYSRIMEEVYII